MKNIATLLLLVAGCFAGNSSAKAQAPGPGDVITGKWISEDKSRTFEFVKNDTVYEAIIRDAPDKNLLGKKQITGLQYDGKSYWNGQIYLPKKGKSYPCTIRLKNTDVIELSAHAGMVSKSQTWTRIK